MYIVYDIVIVRGGKIGCDIYSIRGGESTIVVGENGSDNDNDNDSDRQGIRKEGIRGEEGRR